MTTPTDTPRETTADAVRQRVNGAELLDEVAATITRYVILPSPAALVAVVLWIAATHAMEAWNCAARLVIRAPQRRCGKSRLLDMVEAMCHQPLMSANASPSAVYRSIGLNPNDPPTLLLDEADTIFGPKAGDHEDLRGLLNAGHQRGRPTKRFNAGLNRVESHETFAMAALAGIGAMPDTIEDRAAVIRMRRRAKGETVQPYRVRRDGPALALVGYRLHEWLTAHVDQLADAMPAMPLEDRAADTWEPLIAVADLAGGRWPGDARQAALTLLAEQEDSAELPLSVRLLDDCRTAFRSDDALPTAELLQRLIADEEAPWATLGSGGLSPMKLGMLLRDFEIRSGNIRFPTGQAKGYHRSAFTDAWNRYCPEPDTDADTADDAGTTEAVPAVPAVPMQVTPGTASTPGTAQAVPPTQAVPHLTCEGTPGTAGTAWPLRAVPDLADENNRTDCA